MTDPGCAGCEWSKGQHAVINKTFDDMKMRYDSKVGDAQTIAECVRYQCEKLKENFNKIEILTINSVGESKRATKAVDKMNKIITGLFISLFLMVAATVWGSLAKLGQDSKNQDQTVEYLKKLTLVMTFLEQRLYQLPPEKNKRGEI